MSDQHGPPGLTDLIDFLDASPSPWHAVDSTVERLVGFRRDGGDRRLGRRPRQRVHGARWRCRRVEDAHGRGARACTVPARRRTHRFAVPPREAESRCGRVRLEAGGGRGLRRHAQQQLARPGPRCRRSRGRRRRFHVARERPRADRPRPAARHPPRSGRERDAGSCSTPSSTCRRSGEPGPRPPASSPTGSAVPPGSTHRRRGGSCVCSIVQGATLLGADRSMLAAGRLDNQLSCWAAVQALVDAEPLDHVAVIVLFDHEEVGSSSTTGAAGPILQSTCSTPRRRPGRHRRRPAPLVRGLLVRVGRQRPCGPPELPRAARARSSPDRQCRPGDQGQLEPALCNLGDDRRRVPAGVRTCRRAVAGVRLAATTCRAARRSGRSRPPGSGSTTVDVGVPQLSMHSARELCGADDPLHLRDALVEFLAR